MATGTYSSHQAQQQAWNRRNALLHSGFSQLDKYFSQLEHIFIILYFFCKCMYISIYTYTLPKTKHETWKGWFPKRNLRFQGFIVSFRGEYHIMHFEYFRHIHIHNISDLWSNITRWYWVKSSWSHEKPSRSTEISNPLCKHQLSCIHHSWKFRVKALNRYHGVWMRLSWCLDLVGLVRGENQVILLIHVDTSNNIAPMNGWYLVTLQEEWFSSNLGQ